MNTPNPNDPLGVGAVPQATGGKAKAPIISRKPGAPIGLPSVLTSLDANGNPVYASSYTPPMWIAGQGPVTPQGPYWGAPGVNNSGTGPVAANTNTSQATFYVEGDEWKPGADPTNVPDIKAQLVRAGLLDPTKQTQGSFWGQGEADAYHTLLSYANRYGVDANTMLGYMSEHPATPVLQLSSPMDIQSLATSVIAPLIGRSLSPTELTKFVDDYHRWEAANAENAQAAPQGGAVTSAAQPQSFATAYAKENFGGAETMVNESKLVEKLNSMFKGSG